MSAQDPDNLDAKRAMDELTSQCYTSFTRQGGNVYPESETEQALRAENARLKTHIIYNRDGTMMTQSQANRLMAGWDEIAALKAQVLAARGALTEARAWLEEDAYMTEVSTGREICNSCGESAPTRKLVSHHRDCLWDEVFRRFDVALKGAK